MKPPVYKETKLLMDLLISALIMFFFNPTADIAFRKPTLGKEDGASTWIFEAEPRIWPHHVVNLM